MFLSISWILLFTLLGNAAAKDRLTSYQINGAQLIYQTDTYILFQSENDVLVQLDGYGLDAANTTRLTLNSSSCDDYILSSEIVHESGSEEKASFWIEASKLEPTADSRYLYFCLGNEPGDFQHQGELRILHVILEEDEQPNSLIRDLSIAGIAFLFYVFFCSAMMIFNVDECAIEDYKATLGFVWGKRQAMNGDYTSTVLHADLTVTNPLTIRQQKHARTSGDSKQAKWPIKVLEVVVQNATINLVFVCILSKICDTICSVVLEDWLNFSTPNMTAGTKFGYKTLSTVLTSVITLAGELGPQTLSMTCKDPIKWSARFAALLSMFLWPLSKMRELICGCRKNSVYQHSASASHRTTMLTKVVASKLEYSQKKICFELSKMCMYDISHYKDAHNFKWPLNLEVSRQDLENVKGCTAILIYGGDVNDVQGVLRLDADPTNNAAFIGFSVNTILTNWQVCSAPCLHVFEDDLASFVYCAFAQTQYPLAVVWKGKRDGRSVKMKPENCELVCTITPTDILTFNLS